MMDQPLRVEPKWPTIFLLIAVLFAGIIIGQLLTFHTAIAPHQELAPCATEDSTGCHWDADEQGNGRGTDLYNGVPACTNAIADAGGICHGEPTD